MSDVQIKKILLPIDGSDASMKAARYAVKIAKDEKAQIICIHAIGTPVYISAYENPVLLPSYYEQAKKLVEEWFKSIAEIAEKEGVDIETHVIIDIVSVVDSIVRYASDKNADLIVMGTKGRTALKRFFIGSIASGVVTHAHCPVLVVR